MSDFDLVIVGGGINGTGIARDAAGRGLRVLLVEQNDLASGTSSASTKLIHGGLRYLEKGWFGLVRESLAEREVLPRMAPHLIQPMRFILPHEPGMRPAWLLRLGLFIYDHMGGRKLLPPTRTIELSGGGALGAPLKGPYITGFEYSDCRVDDARLVVLNAVDAAERGAVIRTRTRCIRADRSDIWTLVLDVRGRRDVVTADVLVNAAGPWADQLYKMAMPGDTRPHLRLVQGSHIVVRRLFEHDRGYIFQRADGRVVFAIPFDDDFTLVGTTDRALTSEPVATPAPSAEEITYLCAVINDHFRARVSASDVVWSFAGVRALYDDGSAKADGAPQDTPRDYVLTLDDEIGTAPILTVFGGKITTYRLLAEEALRKLADIVGHRPAWTSDSHLPGGDFAVDRLDKLASDTRRSWPFLSERQAWRLAEAYGTRVAQVLGSAASFNDLGPRFGTDLTGAEVRYLMAHEFAQTPDDVLWRRTKLGLRVSRDDRERLGSFMADAIGQTGRA